MFLFIVAILLIADILSHWLKYESKKYPNENIFNWALHTKADITKVIKVFLDRKKERHTFHPVLWEHMGDVIEPFRNIAFEVESNLYIYQLVPCYEIWFVPKEKYEPDELQEITNLILLKFRDYLRMNGLRYRNFVTYQKFDMRIYVRIFYEEFEEDKFPYEEQYRSIMKEKSSVDYGVLSDKNLDEELNLWNLK